MESLTLKRPELRQALELGFESSKAQGRLTTR
ncbi:MAG: hypothetical protein RIS24_1790 [Verrucomicrobiota bacterium]|jgi:hypothetical protein